MSRAQVDHLVVVADSLRQGEAWCEATLGVTPGPGGEHPLMGTHNRLLRIDTADYPCAYLEILAVDPQRSRRRLGVERRWFDMDNEALRQEVAERGPRLVHFVARVPNIRSALAALAARGVDRGDVVQASRMTPDGPLRWLITVRRDGRRLFNGCLPTLIEWGGAHPAASMAASGLGLTAVNLRHPRAAELEAACDAIDLHGVTVRRGKPELRATLHTPRGDVNLSSGGI